MAKKKDFSDRPKVAEAEFKASALDAAGIIKRDIEYETANLDQYIEKLDKIYKNKSPRDLLINPKTGQKYEPGYREQFMKKQGEALADFFKKVMGRIGALIKKNLAAETRLSYLFGKTLDAKAARAKRDMASIMAKEKHIIDELDDLVKYWEGIEASGALPLFRRRHFNGRFIARPLTRIKREELELLREVDKVLSKRVRKARF